MEKIEIVTLEIITLLHSVLYAFCRTNPRTLSEIADRIKPVNFHLVCHHFQLAVVVQLQVIVE